MKKFNKTVAVILVMAIILSVPAFAAAGAPQIEPMASNLISSKTATLSSTGGTMKITYNVTACRSVDELGATQVKLYTSEGRLMKIYYSDAFAYMVGSDCSTYNATLTYNGTVGTRYYAVVTFYAKDGSTTETRSLTTSTKLCV